MLLGDEMSMLLQQMQSYEQWAINYAPSGLVARTSACIGDRTAVIFFTLLPAMKPKLSLYFATSFFDHTFSALASMTC